MGTVGEQSAMEGSLADKVYALDAAESLCLDVAVRRGSGFL